MVMNLSEERLRAAARDAERIFPSDAQLPPLRLPGPSREHRRGPRFSGAATAAPSRVRLVLIPLAAAAALALVLVGINALRPAAHHHDSGVGGTGPASGSHVVSGERKARMAIDRLVVEAFAPATGPQYDHGSKLTWEVQGLEVPVESRCMAALGYHVPDSPGPFHLAGFADNTQWPDLPRIAKDHEFVSVGGLLGGRYSRAEQAAAKTCWARADQPYHALMVRGQAMSTAWLRVVTRIQLSAAVRARVPGLTACATRYGYPANPYGPPAAPIKSFTDFADWVFGHIDGAGSRGASRARMSALNKHWTSVFVTCATPIVSETQRIQLAAQARFLTARAEQVRRLDHLAWQALGPHRR
jgi:hypothetical protein